MSRRSVSPASPRRPVIACTAVPGTVIYLLPNTDYPGQGGVADRQLATGDLRV
jgi:hypothetical protein